MFAKKSNEDLNLRLEKTNQQAFLYQEFYFRGDIAQGSIKDGMSDIQIPALVLWTDFNPLSIK